MTHDGAITREGSSVEVAPGRLVSLDAPLDTPIEEALGWVDALAGRHVGVRFTRCVSPTADGAP